MQRNIKLGDRIYFEYFSDKSIGTAVVTEISEKADGLIAGMKYGIDCPAIDNCISIYDKKGNKLGEYL